MNDDAGNPCRSRRVGLSGLPASRYATVTPGTAADRCWTVMVVSPGARRPGSFGYGQRQHLVAGELKAVRFPGMLLGAGDELVVRVPAQHASAVAVEDPGHGLSSVRWHTTNRRLVGSWKGSGACLGRSGYGCWVAWGSSTGIAGSTALHCLAGKGVSCWPTSRSTGTPSLGTTWPTWCGPRR